MKSFVQLRLNYCGLCEEDYIEVFVFAEEVPRSNPYLAHSFHRNDIVWNGRRLHAYDTAG